MRKIHYTTDGDMITFAPFYGEFGWEVMSWAPYCRAASQGFQRVIITSFAGMRYLYDDFCTDFRDHGRIGRSLDYPKDFGFYHGLCAEHRRYGRRGMAPHYDVLIHARGVARKRDINYRRWHDVVDGLLSAGKRIACIGTAVDAAVGGAVDLRGLPLISLCDLLASATVTVGCSSGTMHLAAACGCDLVVWGDTKLRYRETLKQRYETTWNPHSVAVEWLDADDWNPPPGQILAAIERMEKRHVLS